MLLILKKEKITIFFIILGTVLSLLILSQHNNKVNQSVFSQTIPSLPTATPTLTLTPIPTAIPPAPIETTKMDSPDGSKTLIMQKQPTASTTDYSFLISNQSDNSEKSVLTKKENAANNITIPYNSWSPDNVYFFLKESTPGLTNYYVSHTSGQTFPGNSQSINIQDLFVKKITQYTLAEITGWAAPNLLIVNTKTTQGEQGPSFWFDLPSQSFIQLSTRFN
jgi:hypothetical protein